ncbi:MAG: RodZ domain-containing protein [Pseudomonadota bacterium]
MTNDVTTNNNTDMFETPGQILRLHREQLDMSQQDIAKRIHLDVKIIESIDNDSSEGMPSAIYVRGYLRSYAKTVNADADKIIELYNADSPPPMPEILPEVKPPTQVSSNDKPVKAFTYLITLGLVLLLLIWYQSNFVVDKRPNGQQVNSDTIINGVDITYEVINHPDSIQTSVTIAEEPENINDASANDDLLKLQGFNEEQTIETDTAELTINESSDSPNTVSEGIELTLIGDSWIEIVDSNNNRVFHDLALKGEQYSLKGVAPFNVLLGFSKGVKLVYNGKLFDVEAHSKNGVARFTLPE